MKISLINHTQDALDLMLFTRSTRLNMNPDGLAEVKSWSEEKKRIELEHMLHTIQSSWAFVDYIFSIEDVTRAFTHQLVRHGIGTAFAQQSQRTVDMAGFTYETGPSILANGADYGTARQIYDETMLEIKKGYHQLSEHYEVDIQDARGVLPTNIHTNIIFKANLRTLHDMGLKRLCVKTQGEFQDAFKAMKAEVVSVHPWAERFIRVHCAFHGDCAFHDFPVGKCPVKENVFNKVTGLAYGGDLPYPIDMVERNWKKYIVKPQTEIPDHG